LLTGLEPDELAVVLTEGWILGVAGTKGLGR